MSDDKQVELKQDALDIVDSWLGESTGTEEKPKQPSSTQEHVVWDSEPSTFPISEWSMGEEVMDRSRSHRVC